MDRDNTLKVLIADDNFIVSEMLKRILETLGYEFVGWAKNGMEAVEMTHALGPDVILMDLEMPDMDGLEASQQILKTCPTPIVVVSAYDTSNLVRRAGLAGVGAYLTKPPNSHDLERAIIIAMARFDDMVALRQLNSQLQTTLEQVKTLQGLLPICTSCKNIRDDEGYWHQVEIYIRHRAEVEFTHSICPDCMQSLYPDLYKKIQQQKQEILTALAKLGQTDLHTLATAMAISEPNLFSRLKDMITAGLVIEIEAGGQTFYDVEKKGNILGN